VTEINARIGSNNNIELVDGTGRIIGSFASLTTDDAAHLARELLSCAASLASPNKPNPGMIIGYSELPIEEWKTKTSQHTGQLVLILSVPPGIELVFGLTVDGAKEIGDALVFAVASRRSSGTQSGSVH
jgi:hypothetical protein